MSKPRTLEQAERNRAYSREYQRRKRATMTPEERERKAEYQRQWFLAHPPTEEERAKRRLRARERRKRPDVAEKVAAYQREYRQRPSVRARTQQVQREWWLRRRFRIAREDYDALRGLQGGVCAICRRPPSGRAHHRVLHVDHNHKTGAIRGLLCGPCNTGLGAFRDNPAILMAAISYLGRDLYDDEPVAL